MIDVISNVQTRIGNSFGSTLDRVVETGKRVHNICPPLVGIPMEAKSDELPSGVKQQIPPKTEEQRNFINYWHSESEQLSQLVGQKVSHIDILLLFIELLKLDDISCTNEKLARREERRLQIAHMKKVAESFKSQGNFQLMTNIGAGILSIFAGACPILGATAAGDWIQGKLTKLITSMKDLDKVTFFKQIGKITQSFADIYKGTGEVHRTFSEGHRSWDQHLSDMARTDAEECTRTLDELKRKMNTIEDWLFQSLRMWYETATRTN